MELIKYETEQGEVQLTKDTVKRYLVSGDERAAANVTDQEVTMFLNLCKYQKLNPFLREAYLIKFGNSPATLVVGKDVFTKRAAKNENFNGYKAGVIVERKDGDLVYREGSLVTKNDFLVGGWAEVHRKDHEVPIRAEVSMDEYARTTRDGKLMSNWAKMPATMIRKVALTQALREAFPEDLQGMYSSEELPVDDSKLSEDKVKVDEPVNDIKKFILTKATEKGLYDPLTKDIKKLDEISVNLVGVGLKTLTYEKSVELLEKLDTYIVDAEYVEV